MNIYMPEDLDANILKIEDILGEINLIKEDLAELMQEVDGSLLNHMETRFKNHSLFPVSPLGKSPLNEVNASRVPGGVKPRGILQPIIWLLSETKFIKRL